jgi:hypothetical protein
MTYAAPSIRTLGRLVLPMLAAVVIVLFALAPAALDMSAADINNWYVLGWIVVPLCAGMAAFRTASKCDGSARKAWRRFGLASLLWMAGTIVWASYGWVGATLPYPSPADAFYIVTALLVMNGMFHYSLKGSAGSRIQVTNFGLAISAVVAIGLVIYFPVLAETRIGPLGSAIALAYPTLWLSTLAFGLICFCLYVPERRRFPFLLILGATAAFAAANFFYAFDVLAERYAAGTFYDVFWIVSFALMTWAALEHRPASGVPLRSPERREHALFTTERKPARRCGEKRQAACRKRGAALKACLKTPPTASWCSTGSGGSPSPTRTPSTCCSRTARILGFPIWEVLSPIVHDNEFYRHYCIAMEHQRPVEFEAYFAPLDIWFEDHAFPTP